MQRRAVLVGGGNSSQGKCTVEVVVDGAAEVEIRGGNAFVRNLSGRAPQFRRFECTSIMPPNPVNFQFRGVDGRGRQQLVRDPRNGGAAVVRIEDPDGGAQGYTFDLIWNNAASGGYYPGQGQYGYGDDRWRGSRDRQMPSRYTTETAVRACQDAIRNEASQRFGTGDVSFGRTGIDDNPGRRDWVTGTVNVRRSGTYRFSCSVDFDNGRLRSASIEAPNGGYAPNYNGGYQPNYTGAAGNQAMQSCERAVAQRIRRDGYDRVNFNSMNVDDRAGTRDRIVGTVTADSSRGNRAGSFDFSCSVNLADGSVRNVDVRLR